MALKGQDRPTVPIRAFGVKCVLDQKVFCLRKVMNRLHGIYIWPSVGPGLPAAALRQEGLEQPPVGSGQAEQGSQVSYPKLGGLGVAGNRPWT